MVVICGCKLEGGIVVNEELLEGVRALYIEFSKRGGNVAVLELFIDSGVGAEDFFSWPTDKRD